MSKTLKLVSPIDGSIYAERPVANGLDIAQTLSAARAAQADWRRVTIEERARLCT
ncbi:MAG: aldehyde dehydrogenase family protein, partial [Geminicoccaceae bacterium]